MLNMFSKIPYLGNITEKSWKIRGVKTDPKKTEIDPNDISDLKDVDMKLVISKEKNSKPVLFTIIVEENEYNFMLYDEILEYIDKIRR